MSERKPLIAGNWKMYKTPQEAETSARQLARLAAAITDVEIMVAPPFTAIVSVCGALSGSPVFLGAQNMHWEREGAFTGEVSGHMLKSAGCSHVIIGHSERRQYFQETDETVKKKLHSALGAGLVPVVCVGETRQEREQGKTLDVLDKQVRHGLEGVPSDPEQNPMVVAYEPVWAIGTGLTATSDQAQAAHAHIRQILEQMFGKKLAKAARILYGGSVKPANAAELMRMPDIDGALVGGASLDPETFFKIVTYER